MTRKQYAEQKKKFNQYIDETYTWIDKDVKRFCEKAWMECFRKNEN